MMPNLFIAVIAAIAALLLSPTLACDNHHRHLRDNDRNLEEEQFFDFEGIQFRSQEAFVESGARCSTPDLTTDEQNEERAAVAEFRASNPDVAARIDGAKFSAVTIDTVVAVIHNGSKGKLNSTTIDAQMKVLNDAFASSGFTFKLQMTKYYDNSGWFTTCSTNEDFKTTIRTGINSSDKGDKKDALFLYTCEPSGGILGYAYFPSSSVSYKDGVVIRHSSLPGASSTPYNEGKTATHEVSYFMRNVVSRVFSFNILIVLIQCCRLGIGWDSIIHFKEAVQMGEIRSMTLLLRHRLPSVAQLAAAHAVVSTRLIILWTTRYELYSHEKISLF